MIEVSVALQSFGNTFFDSNVFNSNVTEVSNPHMSMVLTMKRKKFHSLTVKN